MMSDSDGRSNTTTLLRALKLDTNASPSHGAGDASTSGEPTPPPSLPDHEAGVSTGLALRPAPRIPSITGLTEAQLSQITPPITVTDATQTSQWLDEGRGEGGVRPTSIYDRQLPQLPLDTTDIDPLRLAGLELHNQVPQAEAPSSSETVGGAAIGSDWPLPRPATVNYANSAPYLPIRDEFMQGRAHTPPHATNLHTQPHHHHQHYRPTSPDQTPLAIALHHQPEQRHSAPHLHQYSSLLPTEEPGSGRPTQVYHQRRSSLAASNLSPVGQRHDSEGGLPRWQLDTEVESCPICSNRFTLFYRRHHCRKCGRVVCAPCSPHRIVIPNSYVVYPPTLTSLDGEPPRADGIPHELAALAGMVASGPASRSGRPFYQEDVGVEVRICEDCLAGETDSNRRRRRRAMENGDNAPAGSPGGAGRFWEDEASRNSAISSRDASLQNGRRRSRSSVHGIVGRPPPYSSTSSPHHHHSHSLGRTPSHAIPPHYLHQGGPVPPTNQPFNPFNANPNSNPNFRPPPQDSHYRLNPSLPGAPFAPILSHPLMPSRHASNPNPRAERNTSPSPVPRPPLKETDYCPICTLPLPPIPPNGDEREREDHINDCIRLAEASVSPQEAGRRLATNTNSSPSSMPDSTPPHMDGSPQQLAARLGTPGRGGRMVVYRATEKDTLEDGEKAECVICFEEFEVGEAIARLECLCVYHKKCIREWFDRKGNGECPVHAVHE